MVALEDIIAHDCTHLAEDWLPVSSAGRVERIETTASSVQRLPEGMRALRRVGCNACMDLAADWLPASSRTSVMDICVPLLLQIPEGMESMTRVHTL
jgi:hypothetical protein